MKQMKWNEKFMQNLFLGWDLDRRPPEWQPEMVTLDHATRLVKVCVN